MNLHVLFVRNQSCWWNLKSTALHLNEYTMEPKQDPQTPPAQLLKSQWKFKHWVSLTLLTVQFESYSSFWAVLLFSSNLQVTDNVNTVLSDKVSINLLLFPHKDNFCLHLKFISIFLIYKGMFFSFFLTLQPGMQAFSSLIRDWTCDPVAEADS